MLGQAPKVGHSGFVGQAKVGQTTATEGHPNLVGQPAGCDAHTGTDGGQVSVRMPHNAGAVQATPHVLKHDGWLVQVACITLGMLQGTGNVLGQHKLARVNGQMGATKLGWVQGVPICDTQQDFGLNEVLHTVMKVGNTAGNTTAGTFIVSPKAFMISPSRKEDLTRLTWFGSPAVNSAVFLTHKRLPPSGSSSVLTGSE